MMRWAEVLLIGAEAAVRTGDAKASTWYNAVRTRAGLASKEPTLENIWEEKRIELSMERDRYFDLVRIDKMQPGYFAAKVWAKNPVRTTGPRRDESARLGPGIDHAAAAAGFARSRSEKLRNAGAERTDPADEQPQTE